MIEQCSCLDLTNKIIISMPMASSATFGNSVIYVCGHDKNGAIGLIVNKPLKSMDFYELLSQLEINYDSKSSVNEQVYFGGSKNIERGFVLHSQEWSIKGTVHISGAISLTSSTDILTAMLNGAGPNKKIIAIGYMHWKSGELEEEICKNHWLISDCDESFIFDVMPKMKWNVALQKIGIKDSLVLSDIVGHS